MASNFSEAEKPLDSSANSHKDVEKRLSSTDNEKTLHVHSHSLESLDPATLEAERRKVLSKMDRKLLPFISFLYLLSFL